MKNLKYSFGPVSNAETTVLILGSIPGDKSLELNEYYGHPRNRFWKVLSTLTNQEQPVSYSDKKELLLRSKIGVWDVAHKANRKGSLDSDIKNESPNDLDLFIDTHKKLNTICFNGKTAEKLFDKYFERRTHITYLSLPSTSPANAGASLEVLYEKWKQLLHKSDRIA